MTATSNSDKTEFENEEMEDCLLPRMPKKIEELWYKEEHLIIFQAEDSVYQLPRTPFTRQSSLFAEFLMKTNNLADLVQVEGTQDVFFERLQRNINGLQVIKLVNVSPKEATFFLNALYHTNYFESPPTICTTEKVIAILKLSTWYEVQFLRKRALAHLELAYPVTLTGWDNRLANATLPIKDRDYGGNAVPNLSSVTLHETFMVLKAAKAYNAPWLLPAACYELGIHSIYALVDHPGWQSIRGGLDEELKKHVEIGRTYQALAFQKILSFLNIQSLSNQRICKNWNQPHGQKASCVELRRKTRQRLDNEGWDTSDPLGMWDEDDWCADVDFRGTCDGCLAVCQAKHKRDRELFWEDLPQMYGWPCWDELLALQVTLT